MNRTKTPKVAPNCSKIDPMQFSLIIAGSIFKFVDQAHYDAVGDLVIEHIQNIMKTKYGLQQIRIPPSDSKWAPQTDIFVSPDWKTNPKMMVLLQVRFALKVSAKLVHLRQPGA